MEEQRRRLETLVEERLPDVWMAPDNCVIIIILFGIIIIIIIILIIIINNVCSRS